MPSYRLYRNVHKWTGIVLAVLLLNIAVTGMLLLFKKKADWIQPPTQVGTPGELDDFASLQDIFAAVFAAGHPAFASYADIDRIDFRPDKRVHKVRSVHDDMEMQVDAVTGEVLAIDERLSDWLEDVHDGSWVGRGFHDWVMPVVPAGLALLTLTGVYLWVSPILKRRRRQREAG